MEYTKQDRQAIKKLSTNASARFDLLEKQEQGEFVAVPELCSALESGPMPIIFSCLSGVGCREELGNNLGTLFETRLKTKTERFLQDVGFSHLTVLIDDCEPCRVWDWTTPQSDISDWCRMVIEDTDTPEGWEVKLWSDLEMTSSISYQMALDQVSKPEHRLLVHQHLAHMKAFPNRKLVGDVEQAALKRVAGYALQGAVLEQLFPHGILLQSETPWSVKDPIYAPLRKVALPIIHPYPC